MKLQNLAIIFLVITIPLIAILSYYLHLQQNTLKLQAEYDIKLAGATKEGIKAFEVNTVDWSEWKPSISNQTKRNEAMATINTFITSLANNLNLSGTAREYMVNYIPAIAVTMYDGYYMYSPTKAPVAIVNYEGKQLYFDKKTDTITTKDENGALPIYVPKTSGQTHEYKYEKEGNEITDYIEFVTEVKDAETEYKHMLSNYMSYTARYVKGDGKTTNVIVNYTLDNRIYVYGKVDGNTVEKDGYLVYFPPACELPAMRLKNSNPQNDSDIEVLKKVTATNYGNIDSNKTAIETEILQEQVLYLDDNGTPQLGTFKYVYDIEHNKLYYDEKVDYFFTINEEKKRDILDNNDIRIGEGGCRYKSVSVLWGDSSTTEYKKIYQVLNGKDKGKWCIALKSNSSITGTEEIDTEITEQKLMELGLDDPRFSAIYKDYSAISYYVESYAFTNWARKNLGGLQQQVYNESDKSYEKKDIVVEGTVINNIFDITKDNDPEQEYSPIVLHKKEIMKNNIITNLNLSISNYSRGTYDFKLPVLTEADWEQVFSNISLITFFQGVPIGLKTYNNYAIATSTTNREYVDPGEIYLTGEDKNYHKAYCEKAISDLPYTGYRSVEYVLKEYVKYDINKDIEVGPIYYYPHDRYEGVKNKYSETACYYCIVNKENFKATEDQKQTYRQAKSYNEALARERYYQRQELIGSLINDIQISVTKRTLSIENSDIIFILDDSSSMNSSMNTSYQNVRNACSDILDTMIHTAENESFYIGFIRFSDDAGKIGHMTNLIELDSMKQNLKNKYGKGGGTSYCSALKEAAKLIKNELNGRLNKRIIIFMTDGAPQDSKSDIISLANQLKSNYGVDNFYSIAFQNATISTGVLANIKDIFTPNSDIINANNENLTNVFKDILYKINLSNPIDMETKDGRLYISDVNISEEQPITIIVTKDGAHLKTIKVTEYPNSTEGVIKVDNEGVYLNLEGLVKECGLKDLKGIKVDMEYFVS